MLFSELCCDRNLEMEVADCTNIVINRIQKLEPENAMKLIGYLLLKHTDQEIIEFAFGSDSQILSLVDQAKAYLPLLQKSNIACPMQHLDDQKLHYMSFYPTVSLPFSSPSSFSIPAPLSDPHQQSYQMPISQNLDFPPSSYTDLIGGLYNQAEELSLVDHLHPSCPDYLRNKCFSEVAFDRGLSSRINMRLHPGWLESPPRACHYYSKGYCKNGINCRFFHGQTNLDGFSDTHNPSLNEVGKEDQVSAPRSFAKLELEIIELLKSKRGAPISLASLPTMYLERYGKMLQADGYLTESQRHGNVGFSLTKLLNQLNNSIQLIDRYIIALPRFLFFLPDACSTMFLLKEPSPNAWKVRIYG
ncbi:hypothetical protein BHE74_00010296 [Ensete ventricosum]|nr:hypothetical protein BHE74_00010296 [Ensete ventricosum]